MGHHNDEDPSQPQHEQPTPAPDERGELPESVGHRARKRALRIGAAGTVVAAVAAAIATTGGGSSAKPVGKHGTTAAHGISALLTGIPQSGNTLGSPTAPVILQYFGDLECSTARAFTLGVLPSIIHKWVRSGELRIEYRSFRTVSEPNVFGVQQVAALAAGMQNKQWYYLEDFYHEQGPEDSGYVTESYLSGLARQVPGLNLELWGKDRHDPQLATQVTQDEHAANAAHFNSTPSLLVGRRGSAMQRSFNQFSALDLAAINEAVRQILRGQPNHDRRASPKVVSVAPTRSREHATNIARRNRLATNIPKHKYIINDITQILTDGR
jgi:protein-disulfide isomerase